MTEKLPAALRSLFSSSNEGEVQTCRRSAEILTRILQYHGQPLEPVVVVMNLVRSQGRQR